MTEQDTPLRHRPGLYHQGVYDGWHVEMWWSPGSQGGPTEMRIRTDHPDLIARGITTGTLRSIPLTMITEELRDDLARLSNQAADMASATIDKATAYITATMAADPRPGRRGRPDRFHAAVALLYAWYADSRHHNPVGRLAEACGVDRRTASSWVRLARQNGMLTPASERLPGGQPTAKAVAALVNTTPQEEGK